MTLHQRWNVVKAAMKWLKTPYHHRACVRGQGADCAMFPLMVYRECGILPSDFEPPEYSMQWHLHHSEEVYLQTIAPFVREKTDDPLPGDFVVFKFGRAFSHGGIVIAWPTIIHSYIPHGVLLGDAMRDGELIGRQKKFFEVKNEQT